MPTGAHDHGLPVEDPKPRWLRSFDPAEQICERCWTEPATTDELGRWLCGDCHTEGLDLPQDDLEAA